MNSPGYRILLYGTALLFVLFAFSDGSAQEWEPHQGGRMSCATGEPDPEVAPHIGRNSTEWVHLMVHEVAHATDALLRGGCERYEALLAADDKTPGHPFRLHTEAVAYCIERAAGFSRGDGSLREIALILSGSPLYRQWGWTTDQALRVLNRVCG